jgi:flagellar motor component MotA
MPSLTPRLAWLGLAIACALLATTSLVLTNWLVWTPVTSA